MKSLNLRLTVVATLALLAGGCFQPSEAGSSTTTTAGNGSSTGAGTSSGSGTSAGSTGGATSTGGSSGGTTGGPTIGSNCTVGFAGGTDPCAAAGLVCKTTGISLSGTTGTCALPGAGQPCEPSVGCVSGDSCLTSASGSQACAQLCTTTSDCTDLTQLCHTPADGGASFCAPNRCSLGDAGSGFATCNAQGTDDGTCVPGGKGDGTCVQSGTAPASGPCSNARGSSSSLICAPQTYCLNNPLGGSACLQLCSGGGGGLGGLTGGGNGGTPDGGGTAADGGAGDGGSGDVDAGPPAPGQCPANAICINPNFAAALGGGGGGPSVCLSQCAGAGSSCPAGTTCQTLPIPGATQSLCLP